MTAGRLERHVRFFWLFEPRRKEDCRGIRFEPIQPPSLSRRATATSRYFAENRATPTVQKRKELGKRKNEKAKMYELSSCGNPSRSFPLSAVSTSIIQRGGSTASFVKVRYPPSTGTSPTRRFYTCVMRLSKANVPKRSLPLGPLGTL